MRRELLETLNDRGTAVQNGQPGPIAPSSNFAAARYIPAFLAVAKYGSFTKAARALCLTQPAVTIAIHQLEGLLGVRLFDRDNHGVSLTSKGLVFISKAEQVVADLQRAVRELGDADDPLQNQLRIAAAPSVAAQILPKAVARFLAIGSDLQIVLQESKSLDICQRVRNNEADLGFASMVGSVSELIFEPLFRDQIGVLARSGHELFLQPGALEWSEVARFENIGLKSEVATAVIAQMPGIPAKVRFPQHEASHYAVLWEMLHDGDSISILPALYAPPSASGLTFRGLREPGWRNVFAVTPKRRTFAVVSELIELARDVAAKIAKEDSAIEML